MKVSQSDKENLIKLIKDKHIYFITFGWGNEEYPSLPDDNNLVNMADIYNVSSISSLEKANKNWKYINDIDMLLFNARYNPGTYDLDVKLNQILIDFINEREIKNIQSVYFAGHLAVPHEVSLELLQDERYKWKGLQFVLNVEVKK